MRWIGSATTCVRLEIEEQASLVKLFPIRKAVPKNTWPFRNAISCGVYSVPPPGLPGTLGLPGMPGLPGFPGL